MIKRVIHLTSEPSQTEKVKVYCGETVSGTAVKTNTKDPDVCSGCLTNAQDRAFSLEVWYFSSGDRVGA